MLVRAVCSEVPLKTNTNHLLLENIKFGVMSVSISRKLLPTIFHAQTRLSRHRFSNKQ